MKLVHQLREDFKKSLKEKDTNKKNIVQMLRSNIANLARDNKVSEDDLKEEDVVGIIARELKQQGDSLEAFEKGGRVDLARETELKIDILKNYLPKQLSEDEITFIAKEVIDLMDIDNVSMKNKGQIMKEIMPRVKGKADGKIVNKIIDVLLK